MSGTRSLADTDADAPAARFLLFLRTLPAGPAEHTRALALSGAHASIYAGLPREWLLSLFASLPSMEALALHAFPFLDHAALHAVVPTPVHASLHTLRATACANATPRGLAHLLTRLPRLAALDLSSTPSAAHADVLAGIGALRRLRRLALRGLGIDDAALDPLVRALGTRLCALDVGGNRLTDAAVGMLLDWSFAPPEYYVRLSTCGEEVEEVGPRPRTDGLTHLRIAANRISARGVRRLLESTRLETLDVGVVEGDVEGVAGALSVHAWRNLKTLRIDSQIVVQSTSATATTAWPSRGSALQTLVLCAVPATEGRRRRRRFGDALVALLALLQDTAVAVLELEMDTEDAGMYASGARADFSFFSGDPREGEGGSSWMGEGRDGEEGEAEVDVLERVAAYRRRCRATGSGWAGKVRVVKDLGGRAAIERAIGGEKWAV